MDQLMVSLHPLLDPLAPAFRQEVFHTFRLMTVAWIACLGRRTLSRVWETTGLSDRKHHSAAFRLFSDSVWNWDDVMRLFFVALWKTFIPGTQVWLVVDDTLCHKRGAKVAFGGIFLDAVLSSKKHKVFRYGNNWVLLGLVVSLPFRTDRYFCLPLLWRVFEKQGSKTPKEHRSKPQLAAEAVQTVAQWLPIPFEITVVADSAYIGKATLQERPDHVHYIGPICWNAALYDVSIAEDGSFYDNGKRLPTLKEILADDTNWPPSRYEFERIQGTKKHLQMKKIIVSWPTVAGAKPVAVILLRDPKGEWRTEALLSTNTEFDATTIVSGYCRRWSVEVAIGDAKGQLGFHEPCVWKKESVQRASPMAWFTGTLVVLWYTLERKNHPQAKRHRPWYPKEKITFSDMLSCCRRAIWEARCPNIGDKSAAFEEEWEWLLDYLATAA